MNGYRQIHARVTDTEYEYLRSLAKSRGETMASILRRAIRRIRFDAILDRRTRDQRGAEARAPRS